MKKKILTVWLSGSSFNIEMEKISDFILTEWYNQQHNIFKQISTHQTMELSNDSFLSLLEEHILKRDGDSGNKLIDYFKIQLPNNCKRKIQNNGRRSLWDCLI